MSNKIYFKEKNILKRVSFCFLSHIFLHLPIVVITVQAKNKDWPKLQFGSPETFLAAETPLLLADKTSFIKFSIESSERNNKLIK